MHEGPQLCSDLLFSGTGITPSGPQSELVDKPLPAPSPAQPQCISEDPTVRQGGIGGSTSNLHISSNYIIFLQSL